MKGWRGQLAKRKGVWSLDVEQMEKVGVIFFLHTDGGSPCFDLINFANNIIHFLKL